MSISSSSLRTLNAYRHTWWPILGDPIFLEVLMTLRWAQLVWVWCWWCQGCGFHPHVDPSWTWWSYWIPSSSDCSVVLQISEAKQFSYWLRKSLQAKPTGGQWCKRNWRTNSCPTLGNPCWGPAGKKECRTLTLHSSLKICSLSDW